LINGFYAAKSGAKAFQTSLDITANNIANVNTQGFRAQTSSFTDLIYTNAQGANFDVGNGTRVSATPLSESQGGPSPDGEKSFAIKGEGFFAVKNAQGITAYTRSGDFSVSVEGNASYLVLPGGAYALDKNGQKIAVRSGDTGAAVRQAAIYAFPNPEALNALGNGEYGASAASGAAALDTKSELVESAYELSNVDLTTELTHMMLAQRGIQMNLRMIQTADELENEANNLRT
jgi:flagellar basal body rod protein FlgG